MPKFRFRELQRLELPRPMAESVERVKTVASRKQNVVDINPLAIDVRNQVLSASMVIGRGRG
jgi:hypothetical protein